MEKTFTLYLISPSQKYKHYASGIGMSRLLGKKINITPLALPTLASLTPSHYNITIIDEELRKIPKQLPDIVGITTLSSMYERAYEIADDYRKKDIPVVLGGPHVSFMQEEALQHADAIVVGEAEAIWASCLKDFENNQLQKVYKSDTFCEFKQQVPPRWDLIDTSQINSLGLQISRGCPYNCEFCIVSSTYGRKMRYRDIDNVIAEIESAPLKNFFIVDDNLTTNKTYMRELLVRIKPLHINFTCMASIEIANETELLALMAEAGCKFIVVGFESLNSNSLTETGKAQNSVEQYIEAVNSIHSSGIFVFATFIIGFDNDTHEEFEKLYHFIHKANIWYNMISILGLTPGSDLYYRMKAEKRWMNPPANLRGGMFPVMHYKHFEPLALTDAYFELLNILYQPDDLWHRIIPLFDTAWFATRPQNTEVSLRMKISTSIKIIWHYLIKSSPSERILFFELIRKVRTKKVSPENVIFFLLIVKGLRIQLSEIKHQIPSIKKEISTYFENNKNIRL